MDRTTTAQAGAILPLALVFLLLITVLALGGSRTALLQQRLTAAQRDGQLVFMAAESALRSAEWALWSASTGPATHSVCVGDRCDARYTIEDLGIFRPTEDGAAIESGAQHGRIDTHLYRITARARGPAEGAVRVLESTFSARAH